jgi:hypothetical protein
LDAIRIHGHFSQLEFRQSATSRMI